MTFKEVLKMNVVQRYQYSLYYRNCAAGYEEMLDGLYKDYNEALQDYITALRDSNNPSLVKIFGEDEVEEWICHCNARVDNFANFIHEILHDLNVFNNRAETLEKSVKDELTAKGCYRAGGEDFSFLFK